MNTKRRMGTGLLLLVTVLFTMACFLVPPAPPPGTNSAYADWDGDGFVPAQGDPLWDAHYAQEVNEPNGSARLKIESSEFLDAQEQKTEAEVRRMEYETNRTMAGDTIILIILCIVVVVALIGFFHK